RTGSARSRPRPGRGRCVSAGPACAVPTGTPLAPWAGSSRRRHGRLRLGGRQRGCLRLALGELEEEVLERAAAGGQLDDADAGSAQLDGVARYQLVVAAGQLQLAAVTDPVGDAEPGCDHCRLRLIGAAQPPRLTVALQQFVQLAVEQDRAAADDRHPVAELLDL